MGIRINFLSNMALSPAHKFGQILGEALEAAIEPLLRTFAEDNILYLDKQGYRPARPGKKVSWVDSSGNKHDLDYVLERGGTENKIGSPVAFIESAWRRYTKHSRNKAQEIQGAILPLAHTYSKYAPFTGVILGGVFTRGALLQLKSLGFEILYFEYESIIEAFKTVGIDAYFEENTTIGEFESQITIWNSLTESQKSLVSTTLKDQNEKSITAFLNSLNRAISRSIQSVRILPLHGSIHEYPTLDEAISFMEEYNEKNGAGSVIRYEVQIKYNNGDLIVGDFQERNNAIDFLNSYKN